MIRRKDGFALVELIITMAVFVVVIAMASQMFSGLLNQFKQQSKIAETNIEGLIGLQMLRSDLEQAGYGLPYEIPGVSYLEADNGVANVTAHNEATYNDAPITVPRAFVLGNGAGVNLGGLAAASDVLVIKATNMGTNNAAHKWGYVSNTGALPNTIKTWTDTGGNAIADENLANGDRVIVLAPTSTTNQRVLLTSGGAFFTTVPLSAAFQPVAASFDTYLIYGVDSNTNLRFPFNRADYYIRRPTTANAMPSRCATNTGILYKGTINQSNGGVNELPILDCVLDLQAVLVLDTNADGIPDSFPTAFSGTAEQIRAQLKGIRVYILAHEGQRDTSYTSPSIQPGNRDAIQIVDPDNGDTAANPTIGYTPTGDFLNYRWKIYTLVVKPYNLR